MNTALFLLCGFAAAIPIALIGDAGMALLRKTA